MKIIVFGATGGTGRLIVQQALNRGHSVTAYVRKTQEFNLQHPLLSVIEGDLDQKEALEKAIQGHHAVMCALGAPLMNRDDIRSWGTQKIIDAMLQTHVNRIICMSSYGAGDSYEHLPPLYKYAIVPLILRHVIKDHNGQEDVIRRSGLQWTIVRPVNLTDTVQTGSFVCGVGKPSQNLTMKISRKDVAAFMVSQITDSTYLQKAPHLSYGVTGFQPSICAAKKSRA